jgi:hypothetical protein
LIGGAAASETSRSIFNALRLTLRALPRSEEMQIETRQVHRHHQGDGERFFFLSSFHSMGNTTFQLHFNCVGRKKAAIRRKVRPV